MVGLFNYCLFDLDSKAPSIDTPLHGFLPFTHIDHLHPDAAIAIAASKDGEKITAELFKGTIGWVPWQKPGFDLGLQLRACLDANPGIRGIMLGSHGLFTWGNTAYESYINTLEVIEICAQYLEDKRSTKPFRRSCYKITTPNRTIAESGYTRTVTERILFLEKQNGWTFHR